MSPSEESMIDFRALLEKYMNVLLYVEGTTFEDACTDEYTPSELAMLQKIAAKLYEAKEAKP